MLPKILFHYCSVSGLRRITGRNAPYLSCTHVSYFSDTAEVSYAVGMLKETCDERRKGETDPVAHVYLDLFSTIAEHVTGLNIFVFCFSERGDLLSQWRGYCPKEGGYSLGFDCYSLIAQGGQQGFRLLPCIYSVKKQKEELSSILDKALHSAVRETNTVDASLQVLADYATVDSQGVSRSRLSLGHRLDAMIEELEDELVDLLQSNAEPISHAAIRLTALQLGVSLEGELDLTLVAAPFANAMSKATKVPFEEQVEYGARLAQSNSVVLIRHAVGFLSLFLMLAPQLKHPGFAEEKEWRLISSLKKRSNPDIDFYSRPDSPLLVPFWKFRHTPEGEIVSLPKVYVGPTAEAEKVRNSLSWYLQHEEVQCPNVLRSSVPYKNW